MKKIIQRSEDRGAANHGWLNAKHSFSFANYYNPEKMSFGLLRVFNDDNIAAGMGFGSHPHDNMEIVTIPLRGSLQHKDSMGTSSVITSGEVQIMSAGTGITHSEFNSSSTEDLQLFQLWVFPKERNIKPRYDQHKFDALDKADSFTTVVSPNAEDNAMWINQDAFFTLGNFTQDIDNEYKIKNAGNGAYIFIIKGKLAVADEELNTRDAIGIWDTETIKLSFTEDTQLLIIDVPMN
jgi:redox-sensitive bicupin YhaK (pirin superfamily)